VSSSKLDRAVAAAPVVLAVFLAVSAWRGAIRPIETVVFAVLFFAWAAAARIAQTRAATLATKAAERQRLEASVQRAVGMAETKDDLLDVAGQALAHVVPGSPAEILIADESRAEIHLAAIAAAGAPGCPVEAAGGCAAMRSGQTQRFVDVNAIDLCPRLRGRPGGAMPALCVPLAVMGRTIGVLHTTCQRGALTDETTAQLEHVASLVGARLRMLQMVDALQRQATTDPLTALPNRRFFEERATRILNAGTTVLVAIADIDQFKRLNDSHGHAMGDRALRLFADSLRRTFGNRTDLVARLGGEEFAILVARGQVADARAIFDRARTDLEVALRDQGIPPFTASFGVAGAPVHGTSLTELLASADRALYLAKNAGRNRVAVVGMQDEEQPAGLASVRPVSIVKGAA
jgi:diguanylate cyclase (GGDEF)-like protein